MRAGDSGRKTRSAACRFLSSASAMRRASASALRSSLWKIKPQRGIVDKGVYGPLNPSSTGSEHRHAGADLSLPQAVFAAARQSACATAVAGTIFDVAYAFATRLSGALTCIDVQGRQMPRHCHEEAI